MEIDIYKAKKFEDHRSRKFILVHSGKNIENLPVDVKSELGELIFFKKMTIKRGDKRIALDSKEAMSNIEQKGYHIQSVKIRR